MLENSNRKNKIIIKWDGMGEKQNQPKGGTGGNKVKEVGKRLGK